MEDIFATSSEEQIYNYLVTDNQRPTLPADTSDALTSLITRAWASDAALRPSAQEALQILEKEYSDELAEQSCN
jgi:hypothetical protein